MNYLSLCLIVKDEDEDYLLEWVDYHLSIGVETFFIYDNESQISVRHTLKEYIEKGLVTVFDIFGQHQQDPAYTHCLFFLGHYSRWLGFIDSDEFIVPKTHTDLRVFLQPYEAYGGLSINWLVFGSSGWERKPPGKQSAVFLHRQDFNASEMGLVKCIVQPALTINALTPHEFLFKGAHYAVGEHFDLVEGANRRISVDKIQINHYLLRSREQFFRKIERGRSDHNRPYYQLSHFEQVDQQATVEDNWILQIIQQHPLSLEKHTAPSVDDVLPPNLFSPTQIDFAHYSQVAYEARANADWQTLARIYLEAVRKYPDLTHTYLLLSDLLLQQGKFEVAWQVLQSVPMQAAVGGGDTAESLDFLHQQAKCLSLLGKTTQAIAIYEKLLNQNPQDVESCLWLAELHTQQGQMRSAIEFFDQVLQIDAWNQRAWEGLFALMKKLNNGGLL